MDFEQFYQDKYPAGIPREVDLKKYKNMVDVFEQAVKKFADKPAFTAVGVTLTYRDLDTQSRNFAAWLQNKTDLKLMTLLCQRVHIDIWKGLLYFRQYKLIQNENEIKPLL